MNVQVLQVAARELLVGNDLDLAISLLTDLDGVAEVAGAAVNLDAVMEELLEGLDVEDLVVDRLGAVDDELRLYQYSTHTYCWRTMRKWVLICHTPSWSPSVPSSSPWGRQFSTSST